MKRLLILVIPALMYADGLKSLLDFAIANNKMVLSKNLTQQAKQKEVESSISSKYPSIHVGGYYQNLNARSYSTPGDIYSGYAKVSVDLYDGGLKQNTIDQKKSLYDASKFETQSYKKGLQLSIVEDFYSIKNIQANIKALEEMQNQLKAELTRVKKFYEVGSATKDDIDKLQAAYSNNVYQIDEARYQLLSLKKLLALKVGKKVTTLEDATIQKPVGVKQEVSDDINALKKNAQALSYYADSFDAAYRPQITLADTYSFYGYDRTDTSHPEGLDNQNKLMLTFDIKLYDDGLSSKQKQSVTIQKMALKKQIDQQVQAQDINVELALSKITTAIAQIRSAKSSLRAAKSAYETVAKKYEVGSIDNVAYLDALTVLTNAKAQYKAALNNLQVAYASYYYYANKNIKEFVQ
ncbi:TolC family protein [Sulfurospirillum sp. 1612]|uniref:TolC family protein n=1 Tax=Sulfurospirillum sp. 1612 TaxID=3094835 RepID=UPI002F9237DD